jgi:predicted CoA-binding protein
MIRRMDATGRMDATERTRLAAILDLQEGRGRVPLLGDAEIRELLRTARRIAVIGASDRPGRPSGDVFVALLRAGYDAVPVTPRFATVHGRAAFPNLAAAVAATGRFEIVDVFRRAEDCPAHAHEAVAAGARVLWLQLGIVSWEAAEIARTGGLDVVMDRCISVERYRLLR